MLERDTRSRNEWFSAVFFVLLEFMPDSSAGQMSVSDDAISRVSVHGRSNESLVVAVNAAVRDASRRLADPECQKIFSDFQDRAGQTLARVLEAKRETGRSYVHWIIFYNASEEGLCLHRAKVAGTNPGDRIVHVCPQFTRTQRTDPGYAATLIIHEQLHSLGLGEDPPSSAAITRQIIARCGR